MKQIKTEEAVGTVLCHDITRIVRGVIKEPVFRKGHIVAKEDIPVLLECGKENLYVWECEEGMLHEDAAAEFLCNLSRGENLRAGEAKEGKKELFAECDGLLKVDEEGVRAINSAGQMMIASRHGDFPVKKGDRIAGTRVIPLVIEEEKLLAVQKKIAMLQGTDEGNIRPLYNILPFRHKKAAIIATGSEIQKGRIADTFTPVVIEKLSEYDTEVVCVSQSGDDHEEITAQIMRAVNEYGADIVLCTGGMSVDPDDRTPLAIRNTGAEIVCYGVPVLPGAMFMLGYLRRNIPFDTDRENEPKGSIGGYVAVMGLPGCVMFNGRTIFDLILPRIMADDRVLSEEISRLGTGGMCLNCEVCSFPNCGFGK